MSKKEVFELNFSVTRIEMGFLPWESLIHFIFSTPLDSSTRRQWREHHGWLNGAGTRQYYNAPFTLGDILLFLGWASGHVFLLAVDGCCSSCDGSALEQEVRQYLSLLTRVPRSSRPSQSMDFPIEPSSGLS
jgi:hypothetical protein